jgi:shikimate dehydrogenase
MHHAAYTAMNLPYSYVAIRAPAEEWVQAVQHLTSLGYKGLNVTVPLKVHAYHWAEHIDLNAQKYGALNTLDLVQKRGTNTDVPGFLDTLKELEVNPPGPVLLLGAGGSARALAKALADEGYELAVYNRTYSKACALVEELQICAQVLEKPELLSAKLLLNTTSVGLFSQKLAIDWDVFPKEAVAYDLAYSPQPTPFLQEAQKVGLKTVDGKALLVAQGARSLEWWLGCVVPREAMLQAIFQTQPYP